MAEERLIDDDKDRKYKIRKNADGEDELYIDDETETDGDEEEVLYEVIETDEDDEDATVMTPEQLVARERARAEAEAAKIKKIEGFLSEAEERLSQGDAVGAAERCERVIELDKTNAKAHCLAMSALTCSLTDFSRIDEAAAFADGAEKADGGLKAHYFSDFTKIDEKITRLSGEIETLSKENEEKRAERRVKFISKRNKTGIAFGCTFVPFVALLIAAIILTPKMFSDPNGMMLIPVIVCYALSAVFFIATVFTARGFWAASSNVKRNETDLYTKLGRKLLELKGEKSKIEKIRKAAEQVADAEQVDLS